MIIAAVDQPRPSTPVQGLLDIKGWAFSDQGVITSASAGFGASRKPLRLGLPRPDVACAHPGNCRNVFVGFEGTVPVPAGPESTPLRLVVAIEDSNGGHQQVEVGLQSCHDSASALPAPFLYGLDLPGPGPISHTLAVEGWVLSDPSRPVDRIELIADGQTSELSTAWPRPDVVAYHRIGGEHTDCGFRGFVISRKRGPMEFELRFYSGDALVESVRREIVVAECDTAENVPQALPANYLEGAGRLYVDLLVKALNGSIYSRATARDDGRDWPQQAHTMLGMRRLAHLRQCVETILHDGIPGDFIETGVWKGGSCILMRGILKAWGDTTRTVWLADSFQGLPEPDAGIHPLDEGDSLHTYQDLAIPLEQVRENFRNYGLLDDQVRFLPGWFCDTLPVAPIESLALLRLDGDMYESTMDALTALYDKLQPGGFCIVDDYGCIPACRAAVHDFRKRHGITDPIHVIDWTGAYWRKQTA